MLGDWRMSHHDVNRGTNNSDSPSDEITPYAVKA